MYGEPAAPPVDPYSDAYNQPQPPVSLENRDRDPAPPRARSRSRSPAPSFRGGSGRGSSHAPVAIAPNPSNVLGIFGLSIRTTERDLDDEFGRFGRVDKVLIVYDQRSGRSRGFGFITMGTTDDAARCIKEMNGVELNGRRIRVDYSVTDRAHAPTPGEYMGHRRRREPRDRYRDDHRDRSPHRRGDRDRERGDRDRDRDRDNYGRDRDWRDRRSPLPARGGGRGYSPEYRRRRSYSRSPPPRSPRSRHDDAPNGDSRW